MEKTNNKRTVVYDVPRLTLRDMLGPLFRHRWVIVLTFSSIFLVSTLVAWTWANHY
jgi:uncharacterized protein involved in exopolysaccharide biosynthesis